MLIIMEPVDLNAYADRADLHMEELVAAANAFVATVAPEQPSDRVTERLTERNIRYYMSEGLIDRPLGRDGASSVFGFRHLVQILAVKRLQALYLPVKRIREIVPLTDEAGLLELLREREPGRNALDFLDAISPGRGESAKRWKAPPPAAPAAQTTLPGRPGMSLWRKYAIADGVELHVRADRHGAADLSGIEKIVAEILKRP